MLTLLVAVTVVVLPFGAVVGLLLLAGRVQRGQQVRVAQQIAVTDAIHRELGAVVAPSLAKRLWGAPRLVIPAPLERPSMVAAVLTIAHRVLRGWDGAGTARIEIVVVPRPEGRVPRVRAA